jgi:hypothetical protein
VAALRDIVVDCARPSSVARFWAQALDGYALRPYDDEEIARLKARGIDDVDDDPSVFIDSNTGGPNICFQLVAEGKAVKNRLHFDLHADDREAEVARLIALGATRLRDHDAGGGRWTVMQDLEGNEFCVSG